MLSDFGIILLAILLAAIAVLAVLGIAWMLRPNKPNEEKLTTYESGEDPIGNANVQFNIKFYIVALIFILFDVELVFLFPWATVFVNKQFITEEKHLLEIKYHEDDYYIFTIKYRGATLTRFKLGIDETIDTIWKIRKHYNDTIRRYL